MKTVDLSTQTPAQLSELFCVLAIAKGKANLERRISRYNQLYHKLEAVEKELQARNGNECQQLAQFYDHPDPQVRLDAALTTLGIFPMQAKAVLQNIVDRHEYPQVANARHALRDLETGPLFPM